MSKDGGNPQRISSVNTNMVNTNMDPRKRVEKTSATIRSPTSTDGSAYHISSRSTPQPQNLGETAVMIAAPSTNNEDAATKKVLIGSLTAFTSHLTADASLHVSYDLAKIQLDIATAQYENMKPNFQKYPAIKEQTTAEKSKAAEKVAKLDLRLKASVASQSKLTMSMSEAIFDLFSRAEAAPRLPEPQLDVVSREDYEGLQDRFQKQQDRFQKQQDLLDQQHDRFEKQASVIERLDKTIRELSEASNQAKTRSATTERALGGDITALKTRVQKVEASDEFEKRSLRDLTATVSTHANDISLVRSDIVQNKLNLAAKEEALNAVSRTAKSAASSASTVLENLSKIERQLPPIKNELNQIWSEINEPGKESVLKRLKKHDLTINNLWTKVESIGKPIDTKPLEDRIESLARDLSNVREDVERNAAVTVLPSAASSVPVDTQNSFDLDKFRQGVVDEATELTVVLSVGHDEHTSLIDGLQEELGLLSNEIQRLNHDHTDEFRKLKSSERASNDRHDSASAKYESMEKAVAGLTSKTETLQTKVYTNTETIKSANRISDDKHALASAACVSIEKTVTGFKNKADTLQSNLESLSEMVKSLQKRPSPSASPANGTETRQFRPLSTQSPGPAQTNGFHPPITNTGPHHLTNEALAVPSNSRTTVTPDQIEGIWASIHSLRQRFDNLTTEEVVKAMVDQSTKMFPAAKEFQAAVNILQNVDKDLVGRLVSLDTRLGSLGQNLNNLRSEFTNHAASQLGNNNPLSGRLEKIQLDLTAAGTGFAQLSKEVNDKLQEAQKEAKAVLYDQNNAINKIQAQVTTLAEVAFGKENE
jgi:chromosome segregation ATPase